MSILQWLFPPRCACCGNVIETSGICISCREKITFVEPPACKICGAQESRCRCGKTPRTYRAIAAAMLYGNTVRLGIKRFKFQGKVQAGEFFADEIFLAVQREFSGVPFDLLAAVPLFPKQLRERGYNQCEVLCKRLSKNMGVPYLRDALDKVKENHLQHFLNREQRMQNIKGVFQADSDMVAGKTVLLVDDIMTTGATLCEACLTLKNAGAKDVFCAVAVITR